MFWKTLKMEFSRAFRPFRVLLIVLLVNLFLLGSDLNFLKNAILQAYNESFGSIDQIHNMMLFDTYKCIIAVVLSALYTASFCKDDNSKYLRFILNRVDITTYVQCRFLANLLTTLLVSAMSFYLYVLIMSPLMPLVADSGPGPSHYYMEIAEHYPWVYVGMIGIIFGLVVSACSSIGLLYSSYHADSFVSIAISGLVFFFAISYIPYGTPFSILNITGISSSIGVDAPRTLMYLWTHVYMLTVVAVCGVLFYRRMKWRVRNGYL